MRKTYMAICATAALGICLTGPKDASAAPVADAGKVYAQTVSGKSAVIPVRGPGGGFGGRGIGAGRGIGGGFGGRAVGAGVGWGGRAVGVRGWGARRVGFGRGIGWRRRGWGWGPGWGLGLGWGNYYGGWGGYGLGLGWGAVGLGTGWGYGGAYPAAYGGGCCVNSCGCGGFF
jgi:hypothetical protein